MAGKIQVHVLGTPRVLVGEEAIRFPYRKTEGVFYYLCVKKQVSRDELVNVFWAGTDEKSGKKSVRQVLYQLKKILGEEILLTQGNQMLALNPELPMVIDWDLTGRDFLKEEGEFLSFFYIKECPEFEDWVEDCRNQQRDRWESELRTQMELPENRRDPAELMQLMNRWVRLNPLSEKVVMTVMDWYARQGQYNLAIQLFYDYKNHLMEELEEEPGEEIQQVFHQVFRMKEEVLGESYHVRETFYARTEELYRINEELEHFRRREACKSTVIRGSMGVGKTALMERILRKNPAGSALVLTCRAAQSDRDFYLRSGMQILHQLHHALEIGEISLPEQEERYLQSMVRGGGETKEAGDTGRTSFPRLENVVVDIFRVLAEQRQILLCVDDMQWMDPLSGQILQTLMAEMGNRSLYLLATYRKEDITASDELLYALHRKSWLRILDLKPFSEEETKMIIRNMLPEMGIEETVTSKIWRRTEGNALMLMDLLSVIEQDGAVPEHIPDMTSHMLELQLKNLSEDQILLLQILSIFMNSADIQEIRVLMPRTPMEIYEILESLQKRYLVREVMEGESIVYAFAHKAYQDYFYQNQSLGKRRIWHQMVAEYYETKRGTANWFELLPYLVYQYERGGYAQKTEQYRVQYYCEFFALNNENFPELRTNMEYDEVALGMSDNEAAILEMAERLIRDNPGGNDRMLAECHFLLGRSAIARGQYPVGLDHIRTCIRLQENGGQRSLLLGAYRQMIFYGIQVDDRSIMKIYLEKGLAVLGEEQHSADYATFRRLQGLYLFRCGQMEEADEVLVEANQIFLSLRSKECHYHLSRAACINYRGRIHLKKGEQAEDAEVRKREYALAEKYFREAIDTGVCRYVTNGMGQFRANLGRVLYAQGDLAGAEASLREAQKCFRCHEGFYWGWDITEVYLAMVCRKLGLHTEGIEHLREAEKMVPIMGNPENMEMLECCRALYGDVRM